MTQPRARTVPLRLLVALWAVALSAGGSVLQMWLGGPEASNPLGIGGSGGRWAVGWALAAGAAGLLMVLLNHCVLRPLRQLSKVVERAGQGDWSSALPRSRIRELDLAAQGIERSRATLADTLARLSESESRFRALTECAPDAILTVRADGRIDQFNRAAERLFAYSATEARGQPLSLLLEDGVAQHHAQLFSAFAARGDLGSRRMEGGRMVRGRRRDGRVLSLEIGISGARIAGEWIYTAMIRDVSDRVAAEAELQEYRQRLETLVLERTAELARERDRAQAATRSKNEFLANMSHELRTPMNAIIGLSHLALRQSAGEPARHLERIADSANQLMGALNDILDFSKLESGPLSLAERNADIVGSVTQVARQLGEHAAQKGLELVTWVDTDVPALATLDDLRLRQVLLNLCGNAIKFTERGHVTVHVRVMGQFGSRTRLRFEVSDTGIGMSAEILARLGQAFEQADASSTRPFGGLGLGLAICRRVLQLMGSTLQVSSQPGRGSTFWFDLGVEPASDSDLLAATVPELDTWPVLVVDSLTDARHALAATLARQGCHVLATAPGSAARQALRDAEAAGEPFAAVVSCGQTADVWLQDPGPEPAAQLCERAHLPMWIQALPAPPSSAPGSLEPSAAPRSLAKSADLSPLIASLADLARCHRCAQPARSANPVERLRPGTNTLPDSAPARAWRAALHSHWLRISGLRADIAMRRVRDDPEAYGRLLESFVHSHRDDPRQLRHLGSQRRLREGFELAHSLKSSGGAIGSLSLSAAAGQVPPASDDAQAQGEAIQRIEALADVLDEAIACAKAALADAPRPPATPRTASADEAVATERGRPLAGMGPPGSGTTLRGELLEKLRRRDMASLRFAREREDDILVLAGTQGPAVVQAIMAFDFDLALELLGGGDPRPQPDEPVSATPPSPSRALSGQEAVT